MMILSEYHKIYKTDKLYNIFREYMLKSKILANKTIYEIRKHMFENKKIDENNDLVGEILTYTNVEKLMKTKHKDLYFSMFYTQNSQQLIKKICENFSSYKKSVKRYNFSKLNYTGKPKIPKYIKKDEYNLIFTNQLFRQKDDLIYINGNKANLLKDFKLKLQNKDVKIQTMELIPRKDYIQVILTYRKDIVDLNLNKDNTLSIDIGLDNLLTCGNNIEKDNIIISGKGLKSINTYYNHKISNLYKLIGKELKYDEKKKYSSNKILKLYEKRNNIIKDKLHKISRYLVNYCMNNNIGTIIVGDNKNMKQKSKLKNFVQLPIKNIINLIEYKAKLLGINVIRVTEMYTSKTSYLDKELPCKQKTYKGIREKRGLFVSCNKIKINSDLNASYQIMNKIIEYYNFNKKLFNPRRITVS